MNGKSDVPICFLGKRIFLIFLYIFCFVSMSVRIFRASQVSVCGLDRGFPFKKSISISRPLFYLKSE